MPVSRKIFIGDRVRLVIQVLGYPYRNRPLEMGVIHPVGMESTVIQIHIGTSNPYELESGCCVKRAFIEKVK